MFFPRPKFVLVYCRCCQLLLRKTTTSGVAGSVPCFSLSPSLSLLAVFGSGGGEKIYHITLHACRLPHCSHPRPPRARDSPRLVSRVPESRRQSEKTSSWCTSCWTRCLTTATPRAPARRPSRTTSGTNRSWWTLSSRCVYRR